MLTKPGKTVIIATDECNEEAILACTAGSGLLLRSQKLLTSFRIAMSFFKIFENILLGIPVGEKLLLESFPGGTNFGADDVIFMIYYYFQFKIFKTLICINTINTFRFT